MKVALITGAASGIGQALAVRFARSGVAVVGGYHSGDPHNPDETLAAVKEAGGECVMHAMDVLSEEQTEAFAEEAIKAFGRIDYVVANAGIIRGGPLNDLSEDAWNQMIGVNLSGVMRTVRAGVRRMEDGGAIIVTSSFLGSVFGWQNYSAYSAAKAGVVGFSRSMAIELAPRRIRCNTVVPGLIETPQTLDRENSVGAEGLAEMAPTIPLRRVGRASEVAALMHFLTTDEASYITGQTIAADGGLTVVWNKG